MECRPVHVQARNLYHYWVPPVTGGARALCSLPARGDGRDARQPPCNARCARRAGAGGSEAIAGGGRLRSFGGSRSVAFIGSIVREQPRRWCRGRRLSRGREASCCVGARKRLGGTVGRAAERARLRMPPHCGVGGAAGAGGGAGRSNTFGVQVPSEHSVCCCCAGNCRCRCCWSARRDGGRQQKHSATEVLGVPSPADVADAVAVSDTGATAAAAATLKVRLPGGVPAATLPALPARSNRSWTVLMPMLGRSACRGAHRAASSRTFGRPTLWSSSHPPLSVVTAAVVVGLVPTLGATRGLLLMSAVTIAAATVTGPAVRTARRRTLSRPEAYRPPAGASAAYDSTTLGGWLLL